MIRKIIMFVLVMLMKFTCLYASTAVINGVKWSYTIVNGEAEIFGGFLVSAIPEDTSGSITIPSSLGGCPVTSIGDWAFYDCSGITSITIPNSVTSIGDRAFSGCSGLISITIPNSVTYIESGAFENCSGLTSITIPNSVTSIGDWAFAWCDGLTSVTIGNSVTSIGDWAFAWCDGLTSVTIGNSVTSIGDYAFSGCSGLTSITIPNSVTSIGDSAFEGCSGLTSITIPNSVTYIESGAFSGCSGLTSITIPNSVTSIGDYAFFYCSGLTQFIVDLNNPNYKSVNGLLLSKDGKTLIAGVKGDVVIPDGVTSIGDGAFSGCSGLTSITIPNSVTSIGDSAFYACSGLTQFIVGSNNPNYKSVNGLLLSNDGKTLIAGINGDVVIQDGVTSIGYRAFSGCSGLTSITIPNSVTRIGYGAFSGCSGLTSITVPNSVTGIGDSAFSGCSGLISITIPNSVTYIESGAFSGCSGLTSITIPNSVTSIGFYAFSSCDNLKSAIFLGDAPKFVEEDIFYNCADDFTIKVKKGTKGWNGDPNSTELPETWCGYQIEYATEDEVLGIMTELVDGMEWKYRVVNGEAEIFGGYGVSAIPEDTSGSITIPSSLGGCPVTSIGDSAFSSCDGLTSVTIGNSVTSIGDSAFSGCSGLTQFIVDLNNPNYKSVNGLLLSNDGKTLIAGVKGDVVIPDGVTSIGDSAFSYCSGLTSITIPNSVTSIGDSAFYACSGLTQFIVDSNNPNYKSVNGLLLSNDGKTLIAGINGDVVIPDGVTSIESGAFSYCSGLTSITIPNSVTSIGDNAFYACSGLTQFIVDLNNPNYKSVNGLLLSNDGKTLIAGINGDVVIPDGVTSIGDGAFSYCSGLTSITIPNSVTSIGDSAFYACSGLTQFIVGSNNPNYKSVNGLLLSKDGKTLIAGINGDVVIPDSVTSIGWDAFYYCSGLTSITIPNSVTSIGDSAFYACSGLTQFIVDSNNPNYKSVNGLLLSNDGKTLIAGINGDVVIPDGVTSIESEAFHACSGLTSITIPNSVASIGDYSFEGCSNLKSAIFLGDAPNVGWDIFYNCADDFTIKVKKGTKGWNGDPNSTELPETWCGYQIEYARAAVIKDVKFRQRYPWNNKVDIDYTIVGETNDVIVSFIVKDNDVGKTYTPLSFDKEPPITEGTHRITWDADADKISITSTNVVVGVEFPPPPPLYIVADLSGGTSAASYPVTNLSDIPAGGWTDEYKTTKLVLRRITAGKMPRTDVDITLTEDYYVGVFEVTQRQWELVMGSNSSSLDGDTLPVVYVSYDDIRGTSNGSQWPESNAVDASSFMGKLRAKTGINFDLPTEAQWEYACRAGSSGDLGLLADGTMGTIDQMGWYYDNSSSQTHTVGIKTPNAWGLYDMHGNVWEWCLDRYSESGYSGTDPVGATSGNNRVIRGGSWRYSVRICGSSNRTYDNSGNGYYFDEGLRIAAPAGL